MERYAIFYELDGQSILSNYYPKAIYRLSAIPIKLPMTFFHKVAQKMFKLIGNTKGPE